MTQSSNAFINDEFDIIKEKTEFGSPYAKEYLDLIKKENIFRYYNIEITYTDDEWDFSTLNKTAKANSEYKIRFKEVSNFYIDVLKGYAIIYLSTIGKVSSARKRVAAVGKFLNWLADNKIFDLELIEKQDALRYIDSFYDYSINTKVVHIVSIRIFLKMQKELMGISIPDELIDVFLYDNKAGYANRESHKTPNIVSSYFVPFIESCIVRMRDCKYGKNIQSTAAIVVILSQTGLRISELLDLKIDCIDYVYNEKLDKKLCYLKYEVTKRVRKVETKSIAYTYVNELTLEAVEILKTILKEDREYYSSNILFALRSRKKSYLPWNPGRFEHLYVYLGLNISKDMKIVNNDRSDWLNIRRVRLKNGDVLTLPNTHQYRTRVCTDLDKEGVSEEYIATFMSHLSESMKGYHIDKKNRLQEDEEYSHKILYDILKDNYKILGGEGGLKERIDKFIADNGFNIEKDIDAVIASLQRKIPIRQKTGGVCIKSSFLRECYNDSKTNEFYCAYGVCPNICFFYYMIDIAYRQCCELTETIEYNLLNGFNRQAEKEIKMLSIIVNSKLIPEYNEMLKQLSENSLEELVAKTPNIEKFLRTPNIIGDDLEKWKKKYSV